MKPKSRPRVFVDADVLFAGAASPHENSASLVILRMGEITLLDAMTSTQVIAEAERNLEVKFPQGLTTFRLLAERSVQVVPAPSRDVVDRHCGRADPKDLPILVAALREECTWLVTFNVKDFEPGHPDVRVLRPGAFIQRVRAILTHLSPSAG